MSEHFPGHRARGSLAVSHGSKARRHWLGYVGLPVAVAFARQGTPVIGFGYTTPAVSPSSRPGMIVPRGRDAPQTPRGESLVVLGQSEASSQAPIVGHYRAREPGNGCDEKSVRCGERRSADASVTGPTCGYRTSLTTRRPSIFSSRLNCANEAANSDLRYCATECSTMRSSECSR